MKFKGLINLLKSTKVAEEVGPAGRPPYYRQADKPGRNCANCQYFNKLGGSCLRYNTRTKPNMVCRTWKNDKVSKEAASMKPGYIDVLTKEERAAAMRLGGFMKMSEAGMLNKSGAPIKLTADGTAKAVALTALLAGIPLGTAAHVFGRKINQDSAKQEDLKQRIKYYREATSGLSNRLGELPG